MNPRPLAASTLVLILLSGLAPDQQASAQPPMPRMPDKNTPRKFVAPDESGWTAAISAACDEVMKKLAAGGKIATAAGEIDKLWSFTVCYASPRDGAVLRKIASARRLISHLSSLNTADKSPDRAMEMLEFLRTAPNLCEALTTLANAESDQIPAVYAVLGALRAAHGPSLEKYPALTAALCVVHDRPNVQRVNENIAKGATAPELFEFFTSTEPQAVMKVSQMPAELLVHVVNAGASIDELKWAAQKYRGGANVGQRYKDVKYDTAAFKKGTVKKVTAEGFNLQNVLKCGGVCADQAYFASTVGKALGIPTAYVTGESAEVGHAWVGFLKTSDHGRGYEWNFDSGRYDEYDIIRGSLIEPQSGRSVADGSIAVLAESMTIDAPTRLTGAALVDAAFTLRQIASAKTKPTWPPVIEGIESGKESKARTPDAAGALAVLESGLSMYPASPRGWALLVSMAKAGDLTLAQKRQWGGTLDTLTGGKYPDFSIDVLVPMVQTVSDSAEQSSLWDSMFKSFQKRPDLASRIRFAQGEMWEKAGDLDKAQRCYDEIADKFISDGPFAVSALASSERLLKLRKQDQLVATLYRKAFTKVRKPQQMAPQFAMQSNWFRIGMQYAQVLDDSGNTKEAARIRKQIGVGE